MALEVDLTTVGAVCGIAASVWLITRDVVPVATRVTPRIARFVKRKYAERQDRIARRRAERAEQTLRDERDTAFKAFEASVLRLRDMEQGAKKYHATEWARQIDACKRNTLRVLRNVGVKMNGGSVQLGPWIGQCKTGSIVVDWGPSRWNLGRAQLVVFWHPNPSLTMDEFFSSAFPDGTTEHVRVLSRPLSDADMDLAGWEYFAGWHTDYGYDNSEWIPVGPSRGPGHQ